MQDSAMVKLGPLDERIVHALQIAPRASWARVGEVLGVDPVTVGRHWERMREAGLAWVTAYPGTRLQRGMEVTLLEIDCRAGQVERVADRLAAMPQVMTVEHMVGGRDLLITAFTPDLADLSHLILGRISRLGGVLSTRAQIATRVFGEGSRWRLRALTETEQRELRGPEPAGRRAEPPVSRPDDTSRALLAALAADGRRSVTDLAAATGLSASTVRRRLGRLLDERSLALRCDVARDLTEWPVSATLWAKAPADRLDQIARGLLALSEVRMCMSVTGPHNLVFTVWLRSVADVQRLEAQLAERLPHLALVDRAIALRQIKLMGRLIDETGRAAGVVPMELWTAP
ncbi:Lrp/AsnC family transcriptional regulator [Streptomyces sp. NPDC087512]|uniref:Lrp/AsnC family transcriptional regulator n=1 Tax=unclassified Streptomyces TaxID=2593676 RepID=UPI003433D9DA